MSVKWIAFACVAAGAACQPPPAGPDVVDVPSVDAFDATDTASIDAIVDATGLDAEEAAGPLAVTLEVPRVGYVGESTCVRAIHNGGAGAQITWTWEPEIVPETGGDQSCHTLASAGLPNVFVHIEARGVRVDASAAVRIVPRPVEPRPSASSTIAYDIARDEVWVVNPDADTVAVVSASTLTRVAEIAVGTHPRTLAIAGGTVAVACADDGTLRLIDTISRSERARAAFGEGSGPYGVAADPRGGRFVVTLQQTGELALVDASSGAVASRTSVGFDARGVAMNREGLAVFTYWRSSASEARVGAVDYADATSPVVRTSAQLPREERIDSSTDNSGVPNLLNAIAIAPSGSFALTGGLKANIVTGLYRTGTRLTSQTTARGMFAMLGVASGGSPLSEIARLPLDNHDYISSIAFDPDGARFFVTVQGSETLFAFDAATLNVAGQVFSVGGAPQGVVISPDGTRAFVQGYSSRAVRVFDVTDLSRIVAPLADIVTVAHETLSPAELRGLQIFYHSGDPRMSRTNYISCGTCHLDGDGDNLVWDFTQRGEGLRNTISLRGHGGGDYGPIHWTANFDEIQDFEHDIRNAQGGTGFLADDVFHTGTRDQTLGDPKAGLSPELDALAAYVTSLSRNGVAPSRRDGDPAWAASFARGEAIFRSAATGCATCHTGSRFSDSAWRAPGDPILHDVGTLTAASGTRLGAALAGIDTPTLRGLWRTAPYLHDGSAPTLRDVLTTRNASDEHGHTSQLAANDIDDLVTYLLAIDDRVP